MINVNLLNGQATVKGFSDGKDTTTFLLIWVTVIMTLTFVGVLGYRHFYLNPRTTVVEQPLPKQETPKPTPKATPAVTTVGEPTKEIAPVKKEQPKPKVRVSYNEMSPLEKLNYEKKYAYVLFSKLADATPVDMNFSRISMNSFTTLSGIGTVEDWEEATKLLAAFRQDGWNIRPQPETKIQKGKGFYKITFITDYELQDSVMLENTLGRKDIPAASSLENAKRRVITVAKESGLKLSKDRLTSVKSDLDGEFKHYYFSLNGSCEYGKFLIFLGKLYSGADPIRLTKVELTDDGEPIKFSVTVAISVI